MNITDSISLTATNQYAYDFDEALQLRNYHLSKAVRTPVAASSRRTTDAHPVETFVSGTLGESARQSQPAAVRQSAEAWFNASLTPSISTSLLALPRL